MYQSYFWGCFMSYQKAIILNIGVYDKRIKCFVLMELIKVRNSECFDGHNQNEWQECLTNLATRLLLLNLIVYFLGFSK